MSKFTIYQDFLLVSGIMCFDGCGKTIEASLGNCISECIQKKILPSDARLAVDAEPYGLGIHKLIITIETEQEAFSTVQNSQSMLSTLIKENINFDIIDNSDETQNKKSTWTNWINIFINLISIAIVITCGAIFPPSILLTVGLTSLSFLTTAYTSREYLFAFYQNFRSKSFANMATTISLGWFLSLAHTLFHAITMPMAHGFSKVFMSFIMPMMLITCINGMDEIKRRIMEKSKKIQLQGMKSLFPQMSDKYLCYQLSQEELATFSLIDKQEHTSNLEDLLNNIQLRPQQKNVLNEGMLIEVNPGECFPADCILVRGKTVIDASLLTGESQQVKKIGQSIPSGAINLGQKVTVYAVKAPYNSTVNSLLFRSNRAKNNDDSQAKIPKFAYFYTALVVLGIIGAILAPVVIGVATAPLVMQNIIGILFSMCPCTIAIGHELPKLISMHHRNNKGIHLRDDSLIDDDSTDIEVVVFDKTGTLTTGNSVVESSDIPLNSPLWQRIYLLEKTYGREHPLAKAIQNHYETNSNVQLMFDGVEECTLDDNNRGLSAHVQGKVLRIGSFDYLKSHNIATPDLDQSKMDQGFSAVCVAEDGCYKGVIYIKHEVRNGVLEALNRLKREGKRIIMLTGDNHLSAKGFNKQINSIFDEHDIHAGQTPQDKESFLSKLMNTQGINPKGVWFCGDGLNDAPCCRIVSEKGGVSCAINSSDKSAFFTDISLNGSLDYLFHHNLLNRSLQQYILQNKGVLIYSLLALLAFIISFSIAGIAVSPLIPMGIMLATTFFVLFNSYRAQLAVDVTMDKSTSWLKKILGSNLSLGLLIGASALLIAGVLVATISTGGLALPIFAFTAGAAAAFSSVCTLSTIGLSSAFLALLASSLLSEQQNTLTDKSIHKDNHAQINSTPSFSETISMNVQWCYERLFHPKSQSPDILKQEKTENRVTNYIV